LLLVFQVGLLAGEDGPAASNSTMAGSLPIGSIALALILFDAARDAPSYAAAAGRWSCPPSVAVTAFVIAVAVTSSSASPA
jgi:NhaP-type Na+/H+ and K+/H+ antiporter